MNSDNNENNRPLTEHSLSHIYTPLSEAKKEIWRRWNDEKLRKKVEEFLGGNIPEVFRDKPKAALFRFIATPNFEFQLAFNTAKSIDLEIVFMEFLSDKFCTRNQDKLHLGKMIFQEIDKNSNASKIKKIEKIINIEKCDGKVFKEIETVWGENFIKFHHKIFNKKFNQISTFDVSNFKNNGESPYEVYLKVFSIFVCNGILFENYFINSNKDERIFFSNIIEPAFKKIKEIFGINPLIVPLLSYGDENIFWQYYPSDLISEIIKI